MGGADSHAAGSRDDSIAPPGPITSGSDHQDAEMRRNAQNFVDRLRRGFELRHLFASGSRYSPSQPTERFRTNFDFGIDGFCHHRGCLPGSPSRDRRPSLMSAVVTSGISGKPHSGSYLSWRKRELGCDTNGAV